MGDVKYRLLERAGPPEGHLYQLLSYAIAADVPIAMLIYAADEGHDHASYRVRHVGTDLYVVGLDLAASPGEILAQIRHLATLIDQLKAGTISRAV